MRAKTTRALAAGLAAVVATLLIAEQARAGTYVIRSCNVPGHATAPITPWKASPAANTAAFDTCAQGGGFGFRFPGERTMTPYDNANFELTEPNGIQLRRIRLWFMYRLARGTGSKLVGLASAFDDQGGRSNSHDMYPPGSSRLAAPLDDALRDDVRGYKVAVWCVGFGGNTPPAPSCHPGDAVPLEIRGVEMTLEEGLAPAGSVRGGTLFADGPVSAVRTLDYSASDSGSGLKRIEAIVGGSVLAARDLSASCPHADFAACPTSAGGTLAIDTRRVADGTHPVILRLTDAAGNQKSDQIQLIRVRNAPGPPAAGAPPADAAGASAKLTARFARTRRSSRVVGFGRRVRIRGRLTDAAKEGVGGARIEVLQRTRRSRERRVATVKTRSNGRFSYRRRMRGPTRTLRVVYRPHAGEGVATRSRKLNVRVRAVARLRVSLRGRMLRFRGRVLSRPLPKRGKRVRLQGRAPGFAWSTFAKRRADRRGRFSGRYRLPVRRPGVRIAVRVIVPGERGYRYLSYRGKARKLRVR